MAQDKVITTYIFPDGHKVSRIRPDVFRRAIEAARAVSGPVLTQDGKTIGIGQAADDSGDAAVTEPKLGRKR